MTAKVIINLQVTKKSNNFALSHLFYIMFYCDNCGNPVPDNMHYCPSCGAPILVRSGSTKRPRKGDEINPWVVMALIVLGAGMWAWYYFATRNKTAPAQIPQQTVVTDTVSAATVPADDEPLDTFPAYLEPEPLPDEYPDTAYYSPDHQEQPAEPMRDGGL